MFGFKYVKVCGGRLCYFLDHIKWHNLWVMLYTWNSELNLYWIFFLKTFVAYDLNVMEQFKSLPIMLGV